MISNFTKSTKTTTSWALKSIWETCTSVQVKKQSKLLQPGRVHCARALDHMWGGVNVPNKQVLLSTAVNINRGLECYQFSRTCALISRWLIGIQGCWLWKYLCDSATQTLSLYCGLNQSEGVKGLSSALIGQFSAIPVGVQALFENAAVRGRRVVGCIWPVANLELWWLWPQNRWNREGWHHFLCSWDIV